MNILIATDRSATANHAASLVEMLPFHDCPSIHVTSVFPASTELTMYDLPPIPKENLQNDTRKVEAHLAQIKKHWESNGSPVTSSRKIGNPSFSILESADQQDSDLIVVGAVGKSMIDRVMLGSVSDFVATHASCSTMVIRQPSEHSPSVPKTILVALDGSSADSHLINFLQMYEWPDGTALHLMHVVKNSSHHPSTNVDEGRDTWLQTNIMIREHANLISQPISDLIPPIRIRITPADHIGEAITEYASHIKCDLIITGDSHRNFLNRVFSGSTSRYVLRHADCSVAIARDVQCGTDTIRNIHETTQITST